MALVVVAAVLSYTGWEHLRAGPAMMPVRPQLIRACPMRFAALYGTVSCVLLLTILCTPGATADTGPAGMKGYEGAPSYEKLRRVWPWMPGQQNYMSPKDARTKFLVNWNGAVRASYVDTNSPAQQELLDLAPYRLTLEFGSGMPPFFETTDQNQVAQRLGEGFQPIVISSWRNEQISCTSRFFSALFEADRVETGREMAVGFTRLEARNLGTERAKAHLWMYLSTAQSPRWDGLTLLDDQGRVRLIIEPDDGVHVEIHTSYDPSKDADNTQRTIPTGACWTARGIWSIS